MEPLTPEQMVVQALRRQIDDMPAFTRAATHRVAGQLRALVRSYNDAGRLALALVFAEMAAED